MATNNEWSDSDDHSSFQNPQDGCPDWIISTGSDISAVKDRGSFICYTPFATKAKPLLGDSVNAQGVGTIAVRVACPAPKKENVLTLDDVLYCPTAFCNVLGVDFLKTYDPHELSYSPNDMDEPCNLKGADGSYVGMIKWHPKPKLLKLLLAPEPNRTSLDPNGTYAFTISWPQEERQRWKNHKYGISPLTSDEKQWLKQNGHKDEWHFLGDHGLSMYKEEERQEGRILLRQILSKAS